MYVVFINSGLTNELWIQFTKKKTYFAITLTAFHLSIILMTNVIHTEPDKTETT